jgi:hypothetical protein
MDEPGPGYIGLVAERADPDTTWRPWEWRRQPKWSYAPKGSCYSLRMRAFGAVRPAKDADQHPYDSARSPRVIDCCRDRRSRRGVHSDCVP